MRSIRNLTAVMSVVIAALALAATASAKTVTETAGAPLSGGGTVTATLSYTPNPKLDDDTDIELTITRAGQTLVSGPAKSTKCASYCTVSQGNLKQAIHVADLQGNGEPDVFVDYFTGGAHCCSVTDFYTYQAASNRYSEYEQDWGDPGYALETLGGHSVFRTSNDAFAYEFTAYAASGMPLELLSFNGAAMVNVTRNHPTLIAKDAAYWLKLYKTLGTSHWLGSTGIIAPWAADEDELGNSAMVASYLKAQAAAGHLQSGQGAADNGTRFIARLNRFLTAQGYLS